MVLAISEGILGKLPRRQQFCLQAQLCSYVHTVQYFNTDRVDTYDNITIIYYLTEFPFFSLVWNGVGWEGERVFFCFFFFSCGAII